MPLLGKWLSVNLCSCQNWRVQHKLWKILLIKWLAHHANCWHLELHFIQIWISVHKTNANSLHTTCIMNPEPCHYLRLILTWPWKKNNREWNQYRKMKKIGFPLKPQARKIRPVLANRRRRKGKRNHHNSNKEKNEEKKSNGQKSMYIENVSKMFAFFAWLIFFHIHFNVDVNVINSKREMISEIETKINKRRQQKIPFYVCLFIYLYSSGLFHGNSVCATFQRKHQNAQINNHVIKTLMWKLIFDLEACQTEASHHFWSPRFFKHFLFQFHTHVAENIDMYECGTHHKK